MNRQQENAELQPVSVFSAHRNQDKTVRRQIFVSRIRSN
jgi:hypothetical protein